MSDSTLHLIMRKTLILAIICGLFPVIGVTNKTSFKIRFRWIHVRTAYTFLLWLSLLYLLYVIWLAERMDNTPLSVLNGQLLHEIAPSLVFTPTFLSISYKWRSFVHKWEYIEQRLKYDVRSPILRRKANMIFWFFVISRVGSILVKIASTFASSLQCLDLQSTLDHVNVALIVQYENVFKIFPFSYWLCICMFFAELVNTLQWTCCSLFVTLLSLILTTRFRQYNQQLNNNKLQMMPAKYWSDMRDSYNDLALLTEHLDNLLSILVLANFTMETMNIIIFIYWTISGVKNIATCVLTVVNCVQVVVVNYVTQFSVSSIYEESKKCLQVFSLVPSTSYCREVNRLYEQVSADTLALTGCQFFHVTRSVILTMVSTIITYEVVLIQFGDYNPEATSNSTKPLCSFEIPPPYKSNM